MLSKSYCFLQVYQQNSNLKTEVAQLKSSEKNLLNELEELKEKYNRLKNSHSKAEQIMDQLEETKSNFEALPFLTKYIKVHVVTYIRLKRELL